MQIIKYQTEEEAQQIIAEKTSQGFILTEVSNVTEGNFLGFKEPSEIAQPPTSDQQRIADLEMAMAAVMGGAV